MGVTGVLGILTNRLIITHFGPDAFGQYGLLASLPALLPFADLGMAAVIINVVSGSPNPRHDPEVRVTIVTVLRILIVSGLIMAAVAALLTVMGWWPVVLGRGGLLPGSGAVPLLCLLVFAVGLPLSIGQRLLVGLGRTALQVSLTALIGPFVLLCVLAMVRFTPGLGNAVAVVAYLGTALVSAVSLAVAARLLRPQVSAAFRAIADKKRYPSVRAMHLAGPLLVQMMALPVAMQSDRILLSHLTRGDELPQYNLASQLFNIVIQTIAASGMALWPVFARARSRAEVISPVRLTWLFIGLGGAGAGAMAVLSPWLVAFMTDGAFRLDPLLVAAFCLFVVCQAAKYPTGMYMTDAAGLRFQVIPILLMVPVNVGLSWWLTLLLGAPGPVLGSCIGVAVFQVLPNLWYVRRDMQRRLEPDPPTATVS